MLETLPYLPYQDMICS